MQATGWLIWGIMVEVLMDNGAKVLPGTAPKGNLEQRLQAMFDGWQHVSDYQSIPKFGVA